MKIGKIKNLSMQQQVQVNSDNIEELAKVIKNVYNTQETLTTASTTIDVSDIVDWDTNTETGLILSKDGLLFDIIAVVDSTVYIKYWANVKGPQGNTGSTGATGNGIASITKTDTAGLVDTYTVLFTNGNTTTFTVTNGQDGADGQTGATGNGIASVSKTGTVGLVDTYTITFTNGQTTTFTVTNGQDGADFTSLTYKGQWTSGTDYNKFDLVYIEANSVRTFYMLLNDVTNSTVSPDLDTTNFKEMFEIPVSSSAVQSVTITSRQDIIDLNNAGKIILMASVKNISTTQTISIPNPTYELNISGSTISSVSYSSPSAGYFTPEQTRFGSLQRPATIWFGSNTYLELASTYTRLAKYGYNTVQSSKITVTGFSYIDKAISDFEIVLYYI